MAESPFSIEKKVAIVTGGGVGIGKSIALEFARAGADVVIASRKLENLEPVTAEIQKMGRRSFCVALDVRQEDQVKALVERTVKEMGRLDVMVNNAGASFRAKVEDISANGWNTVVGINLNGTFFGCKWAGKQMMDQPGGGSIVNISSIMGIVASEESHPGYPASKAAVRNYTKAAACRYGPQGVRVNSVHPGYMPPMLNATNAAGRAAKIAQTPLRRLGEPIEVAYGVLFLASDEASFVTGTELVIDGGFIAH